MEHPMDRSMRRSTEHSMDGSQIGYRPIRVWPGCGSTEHSMEHSTEHSKDRSIERSKKRPATEQVMERSIECSTGRPDWTCVLVELRLQVVSYILVIHYILVINHHPDGTCVLVELQLQVVGRALGHELQQRASGRAFDGTFDRTVRWSIRRNLPIG